MFTSFHIKYRCSSEIVNIFFLSIIIILASMQAMLIAAWVLSFIPLVNPLGGVVYKEWLPLVVPQRDVLFYRIFVLTAVSLTVGAINISPKRLNDPLFGKKIRTFCLGEGVLSFFILSALFKMTVYADHKALAGYAYGAGLVLAALHKIFWKKFCSGLEGMYGFLTQEHNCSFLRKMTAVGFVLCIVLITYVPNPAAAVAGRLLIGDQYTHFNSFVFAPAWAAVSGNILYVDQTSQYGLGMPIVLGRLAQWIGGFDQLNVFVVIMWGCVIYYVLFFEFLRRWMRSVPLAIFGVVLGINTQMFHNGVFPFVLALPSTTVIRYWFDVLFFLLVLGHLRSSKDIFLWLAGLICGVAVYYMISTGLYLVGCFYLYVLMLFFTGRKRGWGKIAGLFLVSPLTALGLMWVTVGENIFSGLFWRHIFGFINYLVSGAGTLPIFASLQSHLFWASFMGFVMPLVYVASILMAGSLVLFRKLGFEDVLVILISFYGLGLNQYYILFSATTSFYISGITFVLVSVYWIRLVLRGLRVELYRKCVFFLIAGAVYALVTNHNFLSYPNLVNLSRNPLTDPLVTQALPVNYTRWPFTSDDQLKRFYFEALRFPQDARLIRELTRENDKVPVISAFEINFLMQANRRPFFYHFPLLVPQDLSLNVFSVSSMYTTDYLKETIDQLENEKPQWIFMQRIYLNPDRVPEHFEYYFPSLLALLRYVQDHYTPSTQGEYLIAMKRKDTS